jgi:hypothetical protein
MAREKTPGPREATAEEIASLARGLRSDEDDHARTWQQLAELEYSAGAARDLIRAAWRHDRRVVVRLEGVIVGDLTVEVPLSGSLILAGSLRGSLTVADCPALDLEIPGFVAGAVRIDGEISSLSVGRPPWGAGPHVIAVAGGISIDGFVSHGVQISGIGKNVSVEGRIDGGLHVNTVEDRRHGQTGSEGRVFIGAGVEIGGAIAGGVRLSGPIDGTVYVVDVEGRIEAPGIKGDLVIDGQIRAEVGITEPVTGRVVLRRRPAPDMPPGSIESDLGILGHVGQVAIEGEVGGDLMVGARVDDDVVVSGSVAGQVDLSGARVSGGVVLVPRPADRPLPLLSVLGARFEREVLIGDGVSIYAADLRRCKDLDRVDLIGAHLFTRPDGSQARELGNPPTGSTERIPDGEMASIYRQLRVNLEGKGNRPASAFFYRGEMDSRRRAAWQRGGWAGRTEWGWLSLYRVVAGYGLRVAPPLLWFAAAWAVATVVFLGRGLVVLHGGEYVSASWWQAASFTLQSMLSVFRPPDAVLGLGTTIVQVMLRVLGPILLGLAAFAVRDKVAR